MFSFVPGLRARSELACAGFAACCAFAQGDPSQTIVVSAARIEQPLPDALPSTRVISRAEIESAQAADLPALRVLAFGHPGNDPIGVRLGGRGGAGSFALRRKEASLVWVRPQTTP